MDPLRRCFGESPKRKCLTSGSEVEDGDACSKSICTDGRKGSYRLFVVLLGPSKKKCLSGLMANRRVAQGTFGDG